MGNTYETAKHGKVGFTELSNGRFWLDKRGKISEISEDEYTEIITEKLVELTLTDLLNEPIESFSLIPKTELLPERFTVFPVKKDKNINIEIGKFIKYGNDFFQVVFTKDSQIEENEILLIYCRKD